MKQNKNIRIFAILREKKFDQNHSISFSIFYDYRIGHVACMNEYPNLICLFIAFIHTMVREQRMDREQKEKRPHSHS